MSVFRTVSFFRSLKKLPAFLLLAIAVVLSSCTPDPEPEGPVYLSEVFEYVYGPGQHASDCWEAARDGSPQKTKAADSLRGFSGRDLDWFKADRQ